MKLNYGRFAKATVVLIVCIATVFAGISVHAQATSGNIAGIVADQSGAVIAGAQVKATNEATGVVTAAAANQSGEFLIQNLLPGQYDLSASAPGFKTFTLRNFEVQLNNTASAKLVLPVAEANTSVQVSADAGATIDTTTVQIQSTFQLKEVQDLPTATVGLGVLNLSLLSPGVASSGGVGAGTGPSVGGQRPRANNFMIEGIDNNDKSVTGPLVYVPNDAVDQFTLITNQFSPEFGHSAGGQFNVIVDSGTNNLHGRAYEYFQNRNLNAESGPEGAKVPNARYDYNRYGGQVGGPVIKNKLFYFVNFERQTTGQALSYYTCTPTAAGLAELQNIPNLNATNLGIYEKYTPAAPSQVDATQDHSCGAEATGLQYLTVYDGAQYNAQAGEFASGNAYNIPLGNYQVNAPTFTNFDALTTSVNWTISPKDSFRGRYIYNTEGTEDTAAEFPVFFQTLPYRYHLIALSEYHDFSPNLINEARIGFNRYYNSTPSGNYSFPGLDAFPTIYIYDQGFSQYGPDGNAPQSTIQNLYQFTDNLSWTKGKHTMRFGFDGRKYISPQSFTQRVRGDYEWNYLTEYLHDLAPTAFGQRSTGNFFYYGDQTAFYGYANDIWRVTQKLTLNYGIRYEFTSVPVGERTQELNAAASVPGLIEFTKPKPQYTNFVPRIGINYAPDPNTAIRAGFGMAYDVLYDNLGILSFPPQFSSTNTVGDQGQPQPGDPNFLANGGLPAGNGGLATFPTVAAQRAATSAYVPNQKLPYAETWSLGIQHVFAQNYTFEIRYLGTRGIHLSTQVELNRASQVDMGHYIPTLATAPANPDALTNTLVGKSLDGRNSYVPAYLAAGFTSTITSFQPYSESNYNGLAVNLRRRFQKGLMIDASYTWSKTMDDATADVFSTVLTPRRPQDDQNVSADYSRSALDRTNRLTLAAVYDLPFFKHSNWLLKNTLGNWEFDPIYTYESPEYYTVLSGDDANLNNDSPYTDRTIYNPSGKKGTGSGVTAVTNSNGAVVAYVPTDPNAQYIQAGPGALANSSRNSLPIRPIDNLDATAIKRISFTNRYSIEFDAQAFNVLNHAQYIPGAVDNINSVGYTSQIQFQEPQDPHFNDPGHFFSNNARSMQLALKLLF